mmetsp:Transcript_6260/g.7936  ORF Transcript_6260/g.7936 Transcript_6260/m.7936 type:complete len:90 (+) Transcript_6260:356-625(+)
MHIPSFFVGSIASGGGFLLIHRELSYRQRLSNRWLLAEYVENEVNQVWNDARSSISSDYMKEPENNKYVNDALNKWNENIDKVRKFLGN